MVDDDDLSGNIEWTPQKSFSDRKRVSRRIDVQKALSAEAKDRNSFRSKPRPAKNLAPNLKKLRTKIKDVYDDDEDDDENEIVFHFSLEDESSSLINALRDDEKTKLQTQKTLENQKMQQTAGKMEVALMADKVSKQLGLKGLKRKIAQDAVQDISANSETFNKAISRNVAAKTKIRTEGLSSRETANMVKGLRKMRKAAAANEENILLENIKAEELVQIGKEQSEKKTAKMILEKSGRKEIKNANKTTKEKETQKIKQAVRQTKGRE